VLRIILWPLNIFFRFLCWLFHWSRERKLFRREDFDDMNGWEFEEYIAKLLIRNGFIHVEITRGSKDQGVDILAQKDGVSYAIQCKHYEAKVPNKAVQEAYAGARFYGCDVPVVLTNSYFFPSAYELGDEVGVELWDREELKRMIRIARR